MTPLSGWRIEHSQRLMLWCLVKLLVRCAWGAAWRTLPRLRRVALSTLGSRQPDEGEDERAITAKRLRAVRSDDCLPTLLACAAQNLKANE